MPTHEAIGRHHLLKDQFPHAQVRHGRLGDRHQWIPSSHYGIQRQEWVLRDSIMFLIF